MKVKILIADDTLTHFLCERWKKGEIGEVIENDSTKYDFKVKLEGRVPLPKFLQESGLMDTSRIFYFYKNEVEIV